MIIRIQMHIQPILIAYLPIQNVRLEVTDIDPYKHSFLLIGHRQTVQSLIRRRMHDGTSDQDLHCLLTLYSILRRKSLVSTDTMCNNYVRQS